MSGSRLIRRRRAVLHTWAALCVGLCARLCATSATSLSACAGDISAPAILQYFESTYYYSAGLTQASNWGV